MVASRRRWKAPKGGGGSDDSHKAGLGHALLPAVVKFNDHLGLGLADDASNGVLVTEVPDGHVAGLEFASGLTCNAADGLDLNEVGHLSVSGGVSP